MNIGGIKTTKRQKGEPYSKGRTLHTEEGHISTQQLITAIRKHENIQNLDRDMTNEEIRAVITAFADVIFTTCQLNLAVPFPNMGMFRPFRKKGFKGGTITAPMAGSGQITKDSPIATYYVAPKPDYSVIKFDVSGTVNKMFRALTEDDTPTVREDEE